ncbi:DUF4365 domain-containing protein [Serratia liquefaciens]|uniref:DUF4365 domain-containing protein n=1 Tax=Serratia liquefaciens TaxID=614 RepID=UPI001F288682|nr:DUF4365 domain-containing protein [Serratia liquefaciens]MCE9940194.1 DUF4365 domain-containing protein [Serratia liquefaciens]
MNKSNGMTYKEKVAHGNAGEFYFSYWISNNFIWPCRILDIDMGLDAQVEIYDELNHSTGMFIGAQVKTTAFTLEESPSVSVPVKNLVYWESISDPTVIIRVCLNNRSKEPSLYWKHLQKIELRNFIENALIKESDTVSINFDGYNDMLQETDKPSWIELFLTDDDKKIIEIAEGIKKEILYLGEYFESNTIDGQLMSGYPSTEFAFELNVLLNRYDELGTAVRINPRIERLSHEVKSTIESYNLYISIILNAFTEGCSCDSIRAIDFDGHTPINPVLHRIMNGY